MEKRVSLLGTNFDNVTIDETLKRIDQLIIKYKKDNHRGHRVY